MRCILLRDAFHAGHFNAGHRLIIFQVFSVFRHRSLQDSQANTTFARQHHRFFNRPVRKAFTSTCLRAAVGRQSRRVTYRDIHGSNRTRRSKFSHEHTVSLPRHVSIISRQVLQCAAPVHNFSLTCNNTSEVQNYRQTRVVRTSHRFDDLIRDFSIRVVISVRRTVTSA